MRSILPFKQTTIVLNTQTRTAIWEQLMAYYAVYEIFGLALPQNKTPSHAEDALLVLVHHMMQEIPAGRVVKIENVLRQLPQLNLPFSTFVEKVQENPFLRVALKTELNKFTEAQRLSFSKILADGFNLDPLLPSPLEIMINGGGRLV